MKRSSLVVVGVCIAVSVSAQTWQLATGGSWTNTANWSAATVPDSAAASVVLSQNFTNYPATPTITLDRSAAFTVKA